MSLAGFPTPQTCEFCGTTQNGFCLRPGCIDARLGQEDYAAIPVMRPIRTTLPESQFPDLASFKLSVLDGEIDTSSVSGWMDEGVFFVQSAYGDTLFAQSMSEQQAQNTCLMLHIPWSKEQGRTNS